MFDFLVETSRWGVIFEGLRSNLMFYLLTFIKYFLAYLYASTTFYSIKITKKTGANFSHPTLQYLSPFLFPFDPPENSWKPSNDFTRIRRKHWEEKGWKQYWFLSYTNLHHIQIPTSHKWMNLTLGPVVINENYIQDVTTFVKYLSIIYKSEAVCNMPKLFHVIWLKKFSADGEHFVRNFQAAHTNASLPLLDV